MNRHLKILFRCGSAVLFAGVLLASVSLPNTASAESCVPSHDGTCNGHPQCDSGDTTKHCRDTLTRNGYICECRTGKDNRSHDGPGISLGIGIGPGGIGVGIGPEGGGIGFDVSTGGYCDRWGCPGDYWDEPVFYGPVYYDGEWYDGPVYYREEGGEHWYWVHGDWHRDEWRGDRPDWARDVHYGPALGRDYYKSDEFRHSHEHHDWDHGDHHDNDQHGDHDKSHDPHGDKDKDNKSWPHD